jgi:hypothetical protein
LRCGRFRFGPLSVITKADGEVLHLWSARDALVLKALTLVVGPRLLLSPRCVHVKGHGGLKAAVLEVQQRLPAYGHVLRTDVKGYYESIDQSILLAQLAAQIDDPLLLALLGHAIQRTVERGGLYWDIRTGISRGCPLSPLLGALYLKLPRSAPESHRGVLRALHGRHPGADEDPLAIAAGHPHVEPDLRRTESLAAPRQDLHRAH